MNDILEQTKAAVLEKADPRLVPVIEKLVAAGQQVLYSEQTRELVMQQLEGGTDPEAIGAGVAQLAGVLMTEAKGTIPMEALMPAAVLLLCEALKFLQDAGAVQPTPELVAHCAQALGASFLQLVGATPEKLQEMVGPEAADAVRSMQPQQGGQIPAPGPAAAPQPTGLVSNAMGGA